MCKQHDGSHGHVGFIDIRKKKKGKVDYEQKWLPIIGMKISRFFIEKHFLPNICDLLMIFIITEHQQ